NHVAAHVLFVQGCQGDVNPAVTAWDDGDPDAWGPVVDVFAEQLVDAVAAIARGATPSGDRVHIDDARGLRAPVGDTVLGALAGGSQSRAIELLRWHVGDVTLVTVPGEGFHAVERAVRASLGDAVILVGLAPDWHGYLPQP